ncbi:MAG: MFS transporter, partial [Bowdeniella nasicola]|nr:MFS transporter [Bowdeniella nasicola]
VSAITVPVVGKLSDIYGRRIFYLGGLTIFMVGSILSGMSQSFGFLIFARSIQGLGMGCLIPLSQTIIGDIIPPRYRGPYQGYMGAAFAVSSIAGPLLGGAITDHIGWRWLFYITLPLGAVALAAIWKFLHIEEQPRHAQIDYAGILVMAIALVCLLLATSLGGTSLAWSSWQIITLFSVGTLALIIFLAIEQRAHEPLLPPRLFTNKIVTLSCVAAFGLNMLMFGATIYIPVFAQGVLGVSATNSGAILVPMSLAVILTSIGIGLLITRTGSYKAFMLTGIVILGVGLVVLTRLGVASHPWHLTGAMVIFGLGLGACMQVYTLLVQNAVARHDLGVTTAALQFSRNVGATVGIAIFGTIMTGRLGTTIAAHLPAGMADKATGSAGEGVGAVLDPNALAQLPAPIADAVRAGLSDAINTVFVAALPMVLLVFVVSALIRNIPLRTTLEEED